MQNLSKTEIGTNDLGCIGGILAAMTVLVDFGQVFRNRLPGGFGLSLAIVIFPTPLEKVNFNRSTELNKHDRIC